MINKKVKFHIWIQLKCYIFIPSWFSLPISSPYYYFSILSDYFIWNKEMQKLLNSLKMQLLRLFRKEYNLHRMHSKTSPRTFFRKKQVKKGQFVSHSLLPVLQDYLRKIKGLCLPNTFFFLNIKKIGKGEIWEILKPTELHHEKTF